VTRAITERFGAQRIDPQIAADGTLPRELARTRSLHYTTWTLTAAFDLATLGQCVGVDVFSHVGPQGQSLRSATDAVAAYSGRTSQWPWPELNRDETIGLYEVLQRAAWIWNDRAYRDKAEVYDTTHADEDLALRLAPYSSPRG